MFPVIFSAIEINGTHLVTDEIANADTQCERALKRPTFRTIGHAHLIWPLSTGQFRFIRHQPLDTDVPDK